MNFGRPIPLPTILVVGATGNTGRSVVQTLLTLLPSNGKKYRFGRHRILALTRSLSSPGAKHLATIQGVEVAEQNWVDITEQWLRDHNVIRVFIASAVSPRQFADESQFLVNALRADVEYVVRISTTAANVTPDFPAYYPRTHWAIETMLSQPEFAEMRWSSLQPNGFLGMFLGPAADFVKEFRRTGKQGTLALMVDAGAPTRLIDAVDVGILAAHLLALQDIKPHHQARYVLNGPEDVTGEQIVKLVEQYIGTKVEHVKYKDLSFLDHQAEQSPDSKNLILSIKHALVSVWEGEATAPTTSKQILELAPPKGTAASVLKALLEG